MINDFLGIAIVGAVLSLAYDYFKAWFGLESLGNKLAMIVLALVVGGLYWYLQGTEYYQAVLGILGAASTVYALKK